MSEDHCLEGLQLCALVDEFAAAMKMELLKKVGKYTGWGSNSPSYDENYLWGAIKKDMDKFFAGDTSQAVHIANRMAMIWKAAE